MATADLLEAEEAEDEVLQIPSDMLWEFVDGQLVEKQVGSRQGQLANRIHNAIHAFVESRELGLSLVEMVFDLTEQTGHKRRPDVAFVSKERWPVDQLLPEVGDWKMVPTLAVEVVSPSNSFDEMIEKKNEYFRAGADAVWIVVLTAREILVYDSPTDVRVIDASGVLTAESILPGFELPLEKLFGPAPAN